MKINLFSPCYSWKIAEFVLINNHSLIITNLIVLTINTYYFDKGTPTDPFFFCCEMGISTEKDVFIYSIYTAGNRHKQNSWFCKEIREDNFRFWWRRVHEDPSQGMYMSTIEICFFTARILQNQRMLCCGECFHD